MARNAMRWIESKRILQQSKRLRVTETVSLGDKRFVSILQVDGAQYLIGGTAGSISLLATMDKAEHFGDTLRRTATNGEGM